MGRGRNAMIIADTAPPPRRSFKKNSDSITLIDRLIIMYSELLKPQQRLYYKLLYTPQDVSFNDFKNCQAAIR